MFCTHFISDHIAIDNCYYLPPLCKLYAKTKKHWCSTNIKMKSNELKRVYMKSRTCHYFDDGTKHSTLFGS